MPATDVNALLPFVDRSNTSTLRVEANAQREKTSLFGEVLDTVNPLQHVPGVSEAYRAVTKDKISEGAKFAGHVGFGAAIGGPVGAAIGAGVFLIESVFGAIFGGGKKGGEDLVQAENVKTPATALNGEQRVVAGTMRPLDAAIPMQAQTRADAIPQTTARHSSGPSGPSLGTAPVDMNSAQFAALLGAFGGSAPATTAPSGRDDTERPRAAQPHASAAIGGADFANRMAANLDKLDALKQGEGAN